MTLTSDITTMQKSWVQYLHNVWQSHGYFLLVMLHFSSEHYAAFRPWPQNWYASYIWYGQFSRQFPDVFVPGEAGGRQEKRPGRIITLHQYAGNLQLHNVSQKHSLSRIRYVKRGLLWSVYTLFTISTQQGLLSPSDSVHGGVYQFPNSIHNTSKMSKQPNSLQSSTAK